MDFLQFGIRRSKTQLSPERIEIATKFDLIPFSQLIVLKAELLITSRLANEICFAK